MKVWRYEGFKKYEDLKDLKIAYFINGIWYFYKINTFFSIEEVNIGLFGLMERLLKWCC